MKKLLSILLVLSLLLSMVSTVTAASAETEQEQTAPTNERSAPMANEWEEVDEALYYEDPVVTVFTMTYNGQTVSLLNNGGAQGIAFAANTPMYFRVEFDNDDYIGDVFITSTGVFGTKHLQATYSEAEDAYLAGGFFDPSDTAYVPGNLRVSYTKRMMKVTQDDLVAPGVSLSALDKQLQTEGVSLINIQSAQDGDTVSATVVLGEMITGTAKTHIDATISTFIEGVGTDKDELKAWLGIYEDLSQFACKQIEDENGNEYEVYTDLTVEDAAENALVLVKDVTGKKYTKLLLEKAADKLSLGDISAHISNANLASSTVLEMISINQEMDELRNHVAVSNISQEDRDEAYAAIDDLENDRSIFLLATTVIPLFVGAVVVTGGAAMSAAPALLCSGLLSGMGIAASRIWDYRAGMAMSEVSAQQVFQQPAAHGGVALSNDECITKSGSYCLTDNVDISFDSNYPVSVTICLHGHNARLWSTIPKGCDVRIYDCQYRDNGDGTFTGGRVYERPAYNYGTLYIDNCDFFRIENRGTCFIAGGIIGFNKMYQIINRGDMYISGGVFPGVVENYASLHISGGDFSSGIRSHEDGTLNISGGQVANNIISDGEMVIQGGVFLSSDQYLGVDCNGKTTIKKGDFYGRVLYGKDSKISGGDFYGDVYGNGTITGGKFWGSAGGTITGGQFWGPVRGTINGGKFYTETVEYNTTIKGGTFFKDIRVANGGVEIYGGDFSGEIIAYDGGIVAVYDGVLPFGASAQGGYLTIHGGAFPKEVSAYDDGGVEIYGGTFSSEIMAYQDGYLGIYSGYFPVNVSAYQDGYLNIYDGDFSGKVTAYEDGDAGIDGGTFSGEVTVHQNATARIYGGIFSGEIVNYGQTYIEGGEIRCRVKNYADYHADYGNYDEYLWIFGGQFYFSDSQCIYTAQNSRTYLGGDIGSFVEMSKDSGGLFEGGLPRISQAASVTTANIVLQCGKNGPREILTREEANEKISSEKPSYIFLSTTLEGGSMGEEEELGWYYNNHTGELAVEPNWGVEVEPTQSVYAAVYDGEGRMINIVSFEAGSGTQMLSKDAAHIKLLWMNENAGPVCGVGNVK